MLTFSVQNWCPLFVVATLACVTGTAEAGGLWDTVTKPLKQAAGNATQTAKQTVNQATKSTQGARQNIKKQAGKAQKATQRTIHSGKKMISQGAQQAQKAKKKVAPRLAKVSKPIAAPKVAHQGVASLKQRASALPQQAGQTTKTLTQSFKSVRNPMASGFKVAKSPILAVDGSSAKLKGLSSVPPLQPKIQRPAALSKLMKQSAPRVTTEQTKKIAGGLLGTLAKGFVGGASHGEGGGKYQSKDPDNQGDGDYDPEDEDANYPRSVNGSY